MAWQEWAPYVPVGVRRARAILEMDELRKQGKDIQPIERSGGRIIARSFWGKGWCDHLESFSDFANRLPRGRTYVRNGSVCHLAILAGRIEAFVSGSSLYKVNISIDSLPPSVWKSVKQRCSGQIGSMLELLQGRLSDQVMTIVTDRKQGLFPRPGEIDFACDCPDWATMCKHVAAVLYGVGKRLDSQPELLFLLRGVDASELISEELSVPDTADSADRLGDEQLGDIFGIDLDEDEQVEGGGRHTVVSPAKRRSSNGTGSAKSAASTAAGKKKTRKRVAASSARRSRKGEKTAAKTTVREKSSPKPSGGRKRENRTGTRLPKIRPTGKSVARLRKQMGVSAAEFARCLGVSAASVYRWEATDGRLNLQPRPLRALAELQQEVRG